MQIWRICKKKHLKTAFTGIGAAKVGGRWNHEGERVVYASTTLSLASLELFVHVEPSLIPDNLYSISAILPDDVSAEKLTVRDLPRNWRDYPAPTALRDIGSRWIRDKRTLVIMVPSAVTPEEFNILLNPAHPDMKSLSKVKSKPFQFDPRMWK